jgi:hypothetical protein
MTVRFQTLFDQGLGKMPTSPHLLGSPMIDATTTCALLNSSILPGGYKLVQWQRLVTLECSLRSLNAIYLTV